VLSDDVVDLSDRGEPRVPYRLRMRASESVCQVAEALVSHHRQMRAGMAGVGRGTATTFEHDDTFARLRNQISGREAGDPSADDDHIGLSIVRELAYWGNVAEADQYGKVSLVTLGIVVPFSVPSRYAAHAPVSIPVTIAVGGTPPTRPSRQ